MATVFVINWTVFVMRLIGNQPQVVARSPDRKRYIAAMTSIPAPISQRNVLKISNSRQMPPPQIVEHLL